MKRARDLTNLLDSITFLNDQQLEVVEEEFFTKLTQLLHQEGPKKAVITSAIPLIEGEKLQMKKLLTKITGQDLAMEFRVQESLLGGFRIKIGDWKLDATLSSQLGALHQHITA